MTEQTLAFPIAAFRAALAKSENDKAAAMAEQWTSTIQEAMSKLDPSDPNDRVLMEKALEDSRMAAQLISATQADTAVLIAATSARRRANLSYGKS